MGLSFLFVKRAADVVLSFPMLSSLPSGSALILTKPGEGFSFYLDVALMGGVILAAPFITYQAWMFIAPGLHSREKRLVVPFVALAVCGAVGGALFSHRMLFPSMMAFSSSFDSPLMRFTPRVEDTFALYRNTLIGMVMVFQIPTLGVCARADAGGHRWMAGATPELRGARRRHSERDSDPVADPWNQLIFAAPILAMYVVGIAIAWVEHPRGNRGGADHDPSMGVVIVARFFEEALGVGPAAFVWSIAAGSREKGGGVASRVNPARSGHWAALRAIRRIRPYDSLTASSWMKGH